MELTSVLLTPVVQVKTMLLPATVRNCGGHFRSRNVSEIEGVREGLDWTGSFIKTSFQRENMKHKEKSVLGSGREGGELAPSVLASGDHYKTLGPSLNSLPKENDHTEDKSSFIYIDHIIYISCSVVECFFFYSLHFFLSLNKVFDIVYSFVLLILLFFLHLFFFIVSVEQLVSV